jgi:Mrp family chromosome partitioning ATPase
MQARLDGQYQKVALALAAGLREGRLASVVFTTATRKQGATTTALNVARQLNSSCGINTLVVELNRWRPAFSRLFDLDDEKSVAAIAAGKCSRCCVQQSAKDVAVIPVGDFTPLASRSNSALLEAVGRIQLELGKDHPLILWDLPPVLEYPDVLFLRNVLSNVVLVVESGKINHEVLDRVRAEFTAAAITLEGTVMVKPNKPIPGWIYRWLAR